MKLNGTKKQVAWAGEIIRKKTNRINELISKSLTSEEEEKFKREKGMLDIIIGHINDAEFWIENKDSSVFAMGIKIKTNPEKYKKYWETGE